MTDCKWYHAEFCVNDQCPMCADYCPVPDVADVCKWEERIVELPDAEVRFGKNYVIGQPKLGDVLPVPTVVRYVKTRRRKPMLKIIDAEIEVQEIIDANGGYCPCAICQNEDTRCPCLAFRSQLWPGECHCGRYAKVEVQ